MIALDGSQFDRLFAIGVKFLCRWRTGVTISDHIGGAWVPIVAQLHRRAIQRQRRTQGTSRLAGTCACGVGSCATDSEHHSGTVLAR